MNCRFQNEIQFPLSYIYHSLKNDKIINPINFIYHYWVFIVKLTQLFKHNNLIYIKSFKKILLI